MAELTVVKKLERLLTHSKQKKIMRMFFNALIVIMKSMTKRELQQQKTERNNSVKLCLGAEGSRSTVQS